VPSRSAVPSPVLFVTFALACRGRPCCARITLLDGNLLRVRSFFRSRAIASCSPFASRSVAPALVPPTGIAAVPTLFLPTPRPFFPFAASASRNSQHHVSEGRARLLRPEAPLPARTTLLLFAQTKPFPSLINTISPQRSFKRGRTLHTAGALKKARSWIVSTAQRDPAKHRICLWNTQC
jgi:hypothetical protein